MRRLLVVLAILTFAVALNAQENPKYELFGGYSLLHSDNSTPSGWEASGAYNFNHWIGMKLDADGHYSSSSFSNQFFTVRHSDQTHTVTIGPQFSFRVKRGSLFAHTLFGMAHEHFHERFFPPFPPFLPTQDGSDNSFATILGGGGDWNLGKRFAWRGQLDYVKHSFFNIDQSHMRFSTGLVFRFGSN